MGFCWFFFSYFRLLRETGLICLSTFLFVDLYIDSDKKAYNALGFKRFGFFGLFPAVLSSLARGMYLLYL